MSILIKNVILNKEKKDIFIKGNKIERISDNLNLKADDKIDGKEKKAILPGLINCHTHSAMSLLRGYADDLPLKDWLEKKIWPLEKKLSQDDIYFGTKLAILEMIKTGTTTFNDMYWRPEAAIKAIEEIGIRAVVGLVILDSNPFGSIKNVKNYSEIFKKRKFKNITFSIAPHSIYTVSKENLIWSKKFAQENNLLLHIHLSETKKEVDDCSKKYKIRPVEYLDRIGLLDKNTILAHTVWLSDKEIKILAKKKCQVVYNPCSNMKLASGFFPYEKLKKAGVNIAIGTDGAASNNSLDMLSEIKFASLLQKINPMGRLLSNGIDERKLTIAPAYDIFKSATENGAKALQINSGRIVQGKLADFILVDLNHICFNPGYNLYSDLVYACNGDCVSDVIVNGKVLMRDRVVKNESKIISEAKNRIYLKA